MIHSQFSQLKYRRFCAACFCFALAASVKTVEAAKQTPVSTKNKTQVKTASPTKSARPTTTKKPASSTSKPKASGAFRTVSQHPLFGEAHSGKRFAVHHATKPFEIASRQQIKNLKPGLYTFRAWVKSSGGLKSVMSVSGFDGAKSRKEMEIPPSKEWKQLEIKNIKVTSDQCTIGFYSKSPANKWMAFDDVEFYLQLPSAPTDTISPSDRKQL